MPIFRMVNPIQEYDWGSTTSIPDLMNRPNPASVPMAELWMGAHPKAPSRIVVNGREKSLLDAIVEDPVAMVGSSVREEYGSTLPYLFKVLAAEKALSIQSHPNKRQAEVGWERENAAGISPAAADRNYRDANHKPELICALTPFWGLRGFRMIPDIVEDFRSFADSDTDATLLAERLAARQNSDGLRQFFSSLMNLGSDARERLLTHAVAYASRRWRALSGSDAVRRPDGPLANSGSAAREAAAERFYWVCELAHQFPGDIGVLGPLYLNTVFLEPGEAMFLSAGVLHAYLHGTGVELMANSDNVLRGGCTTKHIDVPELLATVDFRPEVPQILLPEGGRTRTYRSGAREFRLSVATVSADEPELPLEGGMPKVVLCTQGSCVLTELTANRQVDVKLERGHSVYITADSPGVSVQGSCAIYIAGISQGGN